MRAVVALGAVAAIGFCVSCGTPSLVSSDPFTKPHQIVQAWWPAHESAFISGDAASLEPLYGHSALEVATGQMQIQALTKSKPKYPRPFRGSTIFLVVPDSGWFLAIINYAPVDQDGRAEPITMSFPGLLFSEEGGTWKVIAADVQAPIPHGFTGGDQTIADPLADGRYIMPASSIAGAYAAFLTSRAAGSAADAPFLTGLTSFTNEFTGLRWPPGSIATARFTFGVETPKLAAYAITTGLIQVPGVVVFALRRTVVIMPRSGCLGRGAGDNWSDIVPVGRYSSVTITTIAVVAASVPLNDGDTSQGRKVIDISAGTDDVGATVVKC